MIFFPTPTESQPCVEGRSQPDTNCDSPCGDEPASRTVVGVGHSQKDYYDESARAERMLHQIIMARYDGVVSQDVRDVVTEFNDRYGWSFPIRFDRETLKAIHAYCSKYGDSELAGKIANILQEQ